MTLLDSIISQKEKKGNVTIAIAGMTCSGKTTLAKKIAEHFTSTGCTTSTICQDSYFRDLKDIPRSPYGYLTDSIHAFCVDEFKKDMKALIYYGSAFVPEYDIATNRRIRKDKIVTAGKVTIIEGLHVITLLEDMDDIFTVFLNTNLSTCLDRRIERDSKNLGVSPQRITEYFNDCILPMYNKFILPQKDMALAVI